MNLYRMRLELDNLLGRQDVGIFSSKAEMSRSMQNVNVQQQLRAVKDEQVDSTEFLVYQDVVSATWALSRQGLHTQASSIGTGLSDFYKV